MKKSILKLSVKEVKNTKAIVGGHFGSGTRSAAGQANNKAELL